MKRKVVFSLLLSLAVLAGCTRPLDTPSSESPEDIPQIEVIESSSQPETSSESASSSEASESSSSSEAESSQPEPSSSLPPVKEPEPTPSSSTAPPPPASAQQPVQPVSALTITFVDSNGVPAAYQEVTCMYNLTAPEYSLGKTDANGKIVFYPQKVGEYYFQLDFDRNQDRVDPGYGLGLGPVSLEYTIAELGRAEEASCVIDVYPVTENTPSDNCLTITIQDQSGKPVEGLRLLYDFNDVEIESGVWLNLGVTNKEGKFFFQYPRAGEYIFMFHHPDYFSKSCILKYTIPEEKGEYEMVHILKPADEY